jgi:hypothetical protein
VNPVPLERQAELESELNGMLNPGDIPRSWSSNELNEYEARRSCLIQRISVLRTAAPLCESVDREISVLRAWRLHVASWGDLLQRELDALPPAERDTPQTLGRRHNLTLSLKVVDLDLGTLRDSGYGLNTLVLGSLMREAGYEPAPSGWLGSLARTDQRLSELETKRASLQASLDEALLTDEQRDARAREVAEQYEASRQRPQRKRRGDGSQYDKYPDGRIVEVTGV